MKYFVSSDWHLGHQAIIQLCGRPFKDVHRMNERIIKNVNERVKPDDVLFLLGDNCFRNSAGGSSESGLTIKWPEYRKMIQCQNIQYVTGNHDYNNGGMHLIQNMTIAYGGLRISMCHDPAEFVESTEYNPIDFWLCGHVHCNWRHDFRGPNRDKLLINVGVDQWRFMPMTLEEVIKYRNLLMKQRQEGQV